MIFSVFFFFFSVLKNFLKKNLLNSFNFLKETPFQNKKMKKFLNKLEVFFNDYYREVFIGIIDFNGGRN